MTNDPLVPTTDHYTHKQYHAALDRASWLQHPLTLPQQAEIRTAENAILDVFADPDTSDDLRNKVKEAEGKVIHDAEHAMFNQCSELIDRMQKDPLFGKTAEALSAVADRLGGIVQEPAGGQPLPLPSGPITHDPNDHYDPGTIRLTRIFEWLKFRALGCLKEINEGLKELKAGNPARWTRAKMEFGEFMKKLDGYGPAIFTFKVRPVENFDGFIVSARISAKYLNPKHSSTTVYVP